MSIGINTFSKWQIVTDYVIFIPIVVCSQMNAIVVYL